MKIIFKNILFAMVFLHHAIMVPHGFAGSTLVGLDDEPVALPIEDIAFKFFKGQKTDVCSYKEKSCAWKIKPVQAVAHCQAAAFFELSFAKNRKSAVETVQCSPLQLFYRVSDGAWIAASDLCEGDLVLCKDNVTMRLAAKKYIARPIKLYIIEVKKHHTFVVGKQKILTHNIFIPIASTIGMAIPFDMILSAGSIGCMFGPVSFCCSVAVAGVAAVIAYQCGKEKHTEFVLQCERAGCYEMVPKHQHVGCGVAVVDLGCIHKATVEDILKGTKEQGNTGGPSKIYEKPGTMEDALKDFEDLMLEEVKDIVTKDGKPGKVGLLSGGGKVTVRAGSKDCRPTLQVWPAQYPDGKVIKIRYGDKANNLK